MKLEYVKAEAVEIDFDLTDISERIEELASSGKTFQPKASALFAEANVNLKRAIEQVKQVIAL